MSGIDIIGDVHAQGTRLATLLKKLGYGGPQWTHPDGREAIYLGDLCDRGNEHAMVFDIVRTMGSRIVMGNHEFNAICYATEGKNGYIREHSAKTTGQHVDFLREIAFGSSAHKEILEWFKTFAIYIETGGIRLTHACWHQNSLEVCGPYLNEDNSLKPEAYTAYDAKRPHSFFKALTVLMKGPEFYLPKAAGRMDAHGEIRCNERLFWWVDKNRGQKHKFSDMNEDVIGDLSIDTLRKIDSKRRSFKYDSQTPVFFGHYNLDETLSKPFANAACLNIKDRIVAYRWNEGDTAIRSNRLVCV